MGRWINNGYIIAYGYVAFTPIFLKRTYIIFVVSPFKPSIKPIYSIIEYTLVIFGPRVY